MSPDQCKTARAKMGWSQSDLARRANVSTSTIRDFEAGRRIPFVNNLAAIEQALVKGGIEFLELEGREGIAWPCPKAKTRKRRR